MLIHLTDSACPTRTAPALTPRLPFSSGCILRLCLLDSKAVIFAYHKLHSRLLAHDSRNKRGWGCGCGGVGLQTAVCGNRRIGMSRAHGLGPDDEGALLEIACRLYETKCL